MEQSQDVHLFGRKLLRVSGVRTVSEFDDKSVVLALDQGSMAVSGKGLSVSKLDVASGEVEVAGTVDAIVYRGQKESFIKRLFK